MFSRVTSTGDIAVSSCPDCYARGEIRIDCESCTGCGRQACPQCNGPSELPYGARAVPWPSCRRCDDTGREKCSSCDGEGYTWGPCPTCATQGEVNVATLAAVRARNQQSQHEREAESWQEYVEVARRWDEEVDQWFARDMDRRIECRRVEREERRQRKWQRFKRRLKVVTCLSAMAFIGLKWGPTGIRWAETEAQRYLHPAPTGANSFLPAARLMTERDLRQRSPGALDALRYEILARRGLKMARPDMARRFSRQPWYRPDTTRYAVVWRRLTPTEQYNLWFLAEHGARRR